MAGEDVKPNVNRDQGAAASPEGQDVKPNVADAIQLVVRADRQSSHGAGDEPACTAWRRAQCDISCIRAVLKASPA